jgi:hypothetical protein
MSETEKLLRRMTPRSEDYAITRRNVTQSSGEFSSALAVGHRTGLFVYNMGHTASGELFWGKHGVTPLTGFPIPKSQVVEIPITDELELWFVAKTGEQAPLYILELQ